MTNDVANWGGNGSAPVRTAVSGFSRPNAARYTDGTFIRTAFGAITAGQDCTVAIEIRLASFDFSGTIFIEWQDAGHSALSYTSTGFSTTHGVVTRIEVSGTAPANTEFVAVIIGNETFSVNTCDVTAHLIEPVPGPAGDFFDGASPGATWDGTAGNSASTFTGTQNLSGTGTITSTATLTSTGLKAAAGTGSVSSTATTSSTGTAGRRGTGAIAATATLTSTGVAVRRGTATLTAVAALTGAGVKAASGTGSISVVATLTGGPPTGRPGTLTPTTTPTATLAPATSGATLTASSARSTLTASH